MKKLWHYIVILSSILLLVGCSWKKSINYDNEKNTKVSFEENVIYPVEDRVYKLYAEVEKIDFENISKKMSENLGVKFEEKVRETVRDSYGRKLDTAYYTSEQGDVLSLYQNGRIFYYNSNYYDFLDTEMLPKQEEIQRLENLISQVPVYLDLEEIEYKVYQSQDTNYIEIFIWPTYKNIKLHMPLNEESLYFENENAPIRLIFYREKICYIHMAPMLKLVSEGEQKIQSIEEIDKAVQKKYQMILGNAQYVVNKFELCYLARRDGYSYSITPVWIAFVDEIQENGNVQETQMIINAITAREI